MPLLTDAEVRQRLEAILKLATPPGFADDVNPLQAMALGTINATARQALREPPRDPFGLPPLKEGEAA